MTFSKSLLVVMCLFIPFFAWADEEAGKNADAEKAEALLKRYLDAVQAKKWAEAKKFLHPDTLKAIAERKKRLGEENHPMAPWYHEKNSYYLKKYQIVSLRSAVKGTFVAETSEDNFQVEEKGMAEGEMASYLIGKKDGKMYVVDKKRQETFTPDAIRFGYKKYFDEVKAEASEEE